MFELLGDIWVFSAVAAIGVFEPEEDDDEPCWEIRVLQRGVTEWERYCFDTEEEARRRHYQIAAEWKKAQT
ncbi:MAG: hypothetical protein ACYDC1_22830 [Limisphaerales bacterium]